MQIVDFSIKKPVTVTVGVLLLLLFGILSLFRIPIQLTPNVDLPEISIETRWEGASPVEVEREIVDVQEEQLKNLDGLDEMTSESHDGRAYISLLFEIGTDIDAALLRVSNKMEQVKSYPVGVDKPTIKSGGRREQASAWMILKAREGYQGNLRQEYDFLDENVKPAFERISGVASSNIYGGLERELQVVFNPDTMAARGVTVPELIQALDIENKNISGGDFDEGKRRYIARTVGEYDSPDEVAQVIIKRVKGIPVTVADVASVSLGYKDPTVVVRHEGTPTIVMNAVREPGTNVLGVMTRLNDRLAALNSGILKDRGLEIIKAYDETKYIYSAIDLVRKNILIGGSLAVVVLLAFLRNFASTVIVATAIPISIVGTFLMMTLFGRNINVVSLAGLSFAIGMVVDNSIVVFENIFRHREMGKTRMEAAYDGAVEVWGAVLASTLTTVAVFLPIVFVQEEAGQLFRDIAIAISSAVSLSLIISITGIPTLSAKILGRVAKKDDDKKKSGMVARAAQSFVNAVTRFVYWMCGRITARLAVIVTLTTVAVVLAIALIPKTEYLPGGNREMIFGILLPPPGYNIDELSTIGEVVEADVLPLIPEHRKEGEPVARPDLPPVDGFFYVAFGETVFMGIVSAVQERTRELLPYIQQTLRKIPGMYSFVEQASLFSRGLGKGKSVEVNIKGPELEKLIALGGQVFGMARGIMPGAQIRPIPGLDLGNPEMQIRPNRDRLSRLGLNTSELGVTVDALVDGTQASTYRLYGDEIDLTVKSREGRVERTQDLEALPIISRTGETVTLGAVADVSLTEGPTQIRHLDSERAVTIQIQPPEGMPLESAMDTIRSKILMPIEQSGQLAGLYTMTMGGTADKLVRTRDALKWNFILAVVISYLLMSALFENFLYPLIIMFSVPLAAAGGFVGLFLINIYVGYLSGSTQPLDIITMLGFIILVGTVVNNAILIVHQSLNNIRYNGMKERLAIADSVRTRLRPIYMSTITTVFGMLPMVLFPGAGSEFYRGLGSVVIGGLLASTVFTVFLIPALLSLALDAGAAIRRVVKR